jgi:hypothetical protein
MASPARIEDLPKAMGDINEVVRNRDSVDPGSGPEVSPETSPTRRLSRGTTIESWTSGRLPGPTAPARRMHSYRAGRRDSACDELRSSGRAERRAPEYDRADASKDHRDRQRRNLPFLLPGVFPPATSICAWIAGPLSLNGLLIVSVRFCARALEELHSSDLCPSPL